MSRKKLSAIILSSIIYISTLPASDYQTISALKKPSYTSLSERDYAAILTQANLHFVYMPHKVKKTLTWLYDECPELSCLVDKSALLDNDSNVFIYEDTTRDLQKIYDYLLEG